MSDVKHGAAADLPLAVYQKLKSLARVRMAGERRGHTLQTTALVHEAYVRLAKEGQFDVADQGSFYAAAAQAMRRILVDHARANSAQKRGGGKPAVSADLLDLADTGDSEQILALDDAISRLEEQASDAAQVVRLRFFAGLSIDQTADALNVSPRSVDRLWTYARAWLWRQLNAGD